MSSCDKDTPQELEECFQKFRSSLGTVQEVIKPLLETPRNKYPQELSPLESAKLDLVSVYSVNALFWTYLITQGVNPRNHPIKKELDRIRLYMGKVKEIEDKDKAPKLEKEAAKRFVRNAMFDLEEKKQESEKTSQKGEKNTERQSERSKGGDKDSGKKRRHSKGKGKRKSKRQKN